MQLIKNLITILIDVVTNFLERVQVKGLCRFLILLLPITKNSVNMLIHGEEF